MEQLEKMSMASQFYKGFKSNKLKSKFSLNQRQPGSNAPQHTNSAQLKTFGVTSLPSDNMGKILTH
jgi:hypothetical protein